jgi:hypothetical protein
LKVLLNSRHTKAAQSYPFEVGEHVFIDGREGEFVVVEVDRNAHTLQLLPVGSSGRIETVSPTRIRIVLPPKPKSGDEKETRTDGFRDSTAA